LASILLAIYAYGIGINRVQNTNVSVKEIIWGVISGVLLYALFFLGFNIFRHFVEGGALNVYTFRDEVPLVVPVIFLVITSFCEEYFWRGYIQKNMVASRGRNGVIVTSLIYASIHLPTFNMPLVVAALIAGLIWGIIYEKTDSIWIVYFSHLVWTELIFVFLPLK
ncbi:CPBP family intramembrane metalloprotease, partial [Candidatus Bathyarchaeota archaeon]|nr:CPBP family intramembrane metalloprotease [Candidatus Bathyarchaeota archaeon]